MDSLLNIVKERGVVNIIQDYKTQFEQIDKNKHMEKMKKVFEEMSRENIVDPYGRYIRGASNKEGDRMVEYFYFTGTNVFYTASMSYIKTKNITLEENSLLERRNNKKMRTIGFYYEQYSNDEDIDAFTRYEDNYI